MNQTVMNDSRTAGTTMGRQHALYHHATSPSATQHREVTPRTATRRARPALLLASLVCLMTLNSCYDYRDELFTQREMTSLLTEGQVRLAMTFNDNNSTRMTATETQAANGSFLGVTTIYAIPFSTALDNSTDNYKLVTATDAPLISGDNLGPIRVIDDNDEYVYNTDPSGSVTLSKSKLYTVFPKVVGTTAYLAYALGDGSSVVHGHIGGFNDANILNAATPASINFTPVSFVANESAATALETKAQAITTYLSNIANATGWAASTDEDFVHARTKFLTMHAAASIDVAAAVAGLYSYFSTSRYEGNDVATAIKTAITGENNSNATISGTGMSTSATLSDVLSGFPSEVGLPDGAAAIAWDEAQSKFVTSATNYNTGMLETSTSTLLVTPMSHFVYPMPLVYRTNSPVVTSNADETDHYENGVTWEFITSNYADGGRVISTTKSVAIEDQLDYAVARLETYVRSTEAILTDNGGTRVTLTNTTFPVTGILVGGQKKVDFEFHPNEDDNDYYVVYDATIPSGTALVNASNFDGLTAVHTLLLENEKATETKSKVPVAIEFRNNSGHEFYGVDGLMVPKGAKFYLAGQLDMSTHLNQRAFEQDKVATLKCSVSTLANAYNVIPDLRDTRLKIGLTVEEWIVSTPYNTELF